MTSALDDVHAAQRLLDEAAAKVVHMERVRDEDAWVTRGNQVYEASGQKVFLVRPAEDEESTDLHLVVCDVPSIHGPELARRIARALTLYDAAVRMLR